MNAFYLLNSSGLAIDFFWIFSSILFILWKLMKILNMSLKNHCDVTDNAHALSKSKTDVDLHCFVLYSLSILIKFLWWNLWFHESNLFTVVILAHLRFMNQLLEIFSTQNYHTSQQHEKVHRGTLWTLEKR